MVKLTMCIMIMWCCSQLYGMKEGREINRASPTKALHNAVHKGDFLAACTALRQGAATNERVTLRGDTCLHIATTNKQLPLVKALIKCNASVNARDDEGLTPLLIASCQYDIPILEYLLSKGADSNARPIQCPEHTPLFMAAAYSTKKVVNLLCLAGAEDVFKTNWASARMTTEEDKISMYQELMLSRAGHIEWLCHRAVDLSYCCSPHEYAHLYNAAKKKIVHMLTSRFYANRSHKTPSPLQDAYTISYLGNNHFLKKYVRGPLKKFLIDELTAVVIEYADETHQSPLIKPVALRIDFQKK